MVPTPRARTTSPGSSSSTSSLRSAPGRSLKRSPAPARPCCPPTSGSPVRRLRGRCPGSAPGCRRAVAPRRRSEEPPGLVGAGRLSPTHRRPALRCRPPSTRPPVRPRTGRLMEPALRRPRRLAPDARPVLSPGPHRVVGGGPHPARRRWAHDAPGRGWVAGAGGHCRTAHRSGEGDPAQRRGRVATFQLQAAIAAVHAMAPTFADADWPQIPELYRMLLAVAPTPAAELGAAIAWGEVQGPAAGLAALEPLAVSRPLDHRVIAARGRAHRLRSRAELPPRQSERGGAGSVIAG